MDQSEIEHDGITYTLLGRIVLGSRSRIMVASTGYGETVAVKIVHKHRAYDLFPDREDIASTKSVMEYITVSEEPRPFLLKLLHSWDDNDNIYFVIPLYPYALIDVMRKDVSHKPDRLYIAELLAALRNLHSLNIVHRDIKPENVFIAPSGHLVLAGFTFAEEWCENARGPFGSRGYMAPEVIMGTTGPYGYASDVWSLGLVIFEFVLRMKDPHFCLNEQGTDDDLIEYRTLNTDFPLEKIEDDVLRDLLEKMLYRDPSKRWIPANLMEHRYFNGFNWSLLDHEQPHYAPGHPSPSVDYNSDDRCVGISDRRIGIIHNQDYEVLLADDEHRRNEGRGLFEFFLPIDEVRKLLWKPQELRRSCMLHDFGH